MAEDNKNFETTKGASYPCLQVSAMGPTTESYFDGLKLTRRHYMMFFLILLGTFFDQMDLYIMSFVGPAIIQKGFITLPELAKINSAMVFTMLFGGLFGGYFADRWGRKKSLLTGVCIFSIFSIVDALAINYEMLLISRSFAGFGIAMLVCTEAGYMSEVTPSEVRGRWFAITFGCSLIASPAAAGFAKMIIPMFDWGWRAVLSLGGLGLIIFCLGMIFLRESPRWLVSKGRYEEAQKVFKELSGHDLTITPEAMTPVKRVGWGEVMRCMFSKNYIRPTIVLAIFMYFIGVAGGFLFISWAPTLLVKHGWPLQTSLEIGFVISIGMPLGGVLAALISDKLGRKIPLGGTMTMYGILAVCFGHLVDESMIMFVGLLMAMCHMAFFTMTATYGAENYPTYIRGSAYSFIYVFSRIGPAIGNAFVPIILAGVGYVGYYMVDAALLIVGGLVVMIFGRSTAGHNLEDLHRDWDERRAQRDRCKNGDGAPDPVCGGGNERHAS